MKLQTALRRQRSSIQLSCLHAQLFRAFIWMWSVWRLRHPLISVHLTAVWGTDTALSDWLTKVCLYPFLMHTDTHTQNQTHRHRIYKPHYLAHFPDECWYKQPKTGYCDWLPQWISPLFGCVFLWQPHMSLNRDVHIVYSCWGKSHCSEVRCLTSYLTFSLLFSKIQHVHFALGL